MTIQQTSLEPGLYVVATPIGSSRDITLRALDVLASADVLVAEDTRTLRKLLELHGIHLGQRRLWSYHDHSGGADRTRIVKAIQDGQSVAYTSDAGTPMIADPGYQLVQDVLAHDLAVTSAPGPSAAINALVLGGMPTDQFHFAGFLPPQDAARRTALTGLKGIAATAVVYETPKRLSAMLTAIAAVYGADHPIAVCREMTKRFETVTRGTAQAVLDQIPEMTLKGEIVLLIGPMTQNDSSEDAIDDALRNALLTLRVKDAANAVAGAMGLPKRDVYQRALALAQKDDST